MGQNDNSNCKITIFMIVCAVILSTLLVLVYVRKLVSWYAIGGIGILATLVILVLVIVFRNKYYELFVRIDAESPSGLTPWGQFFSKIAIPVIGGIGAIGGAVAVILIYHTTSMQIDTQNKQLKDQLETAQFQVTAEQFNNAIINLGSEKQAVVLGGVHALHHLAVKFEDEYSQQVFDILCSFIREETRRPEYQARVVAEIKKNEKGLAKIDNKDSADIYEKISDRSDTSDKPDTTPKGTSQIVIQTIVDKLFLEKESRELYQKYKYVNLYGAFLRGVNLNGIKWSSRMVNLQNADLLGVSFIKADMQETILYEANLQEADLSYANLKGAVFLPNLQKKDIQSMNLQGADLRRADLSHADLSNANLGFANLQGADLLNAKFQGNNLKYADFRGTMSSPIGQGKRLAYTVIVNNLTLSQLREVGNV